MAMSLSEKARYKAQARAQGIVLTDAQVDDYAKKFQQAQNKPIITTGNENDPNYDPQNKPQEGDDAIWDFVGNTLWGALDTASFGTAGWAFKSIDETAYNSMIQDLNDTSFGRIGGAVGSAAGFLAPMGWVGKGLNLATRGIRTAAQAGKVAKGAEVVNATTRTLQAQSAKKILEASVVAAEKYGTKALTKKEALKIARDISDDVVGHAPKTWLEKIGLGARSADKLEHSAQLVDNAIKTLKATAPQKLSNYLRESGITLRQSEILKLSDDVIEILGKAPVNSVERWLEVTLGAKLAAPVARWAAAAGQEAVAFGITGTIMDGVMGAKGELEDPDKSMMSRFMHHALIGFGLGSAKTLIPGGRDAPIWKDFFGITGKNLRGINSSISKMSKTELEGFASMSLKNDKALEAFLRLNGIDVYALRNGLAMSEKTAPALRQALTDFNLNRLKEISLWGSGSGKAWTDVRKDIIGSLGRMTAGSLIMNFDALKGGHFSHMPDGEVAFHMALGAFMTKRGKALKPGSTGLHGDRPYYYNSDLTAISHELNRSKYISDHIGSIAKEFDGDFITRTLRQTPNEDVDLVVEALKENNIVYNSNESKIVPDGTGERTIGQELSNILAPVADHLRSTGHEINPNVKKAEIEAALHTLSNLESTYLSTPENQVYLNTSVNIRRAKFEGIKDKLNAYQYEIFENVRAQMGILMGDPNYISDKGVMKETRFDDMKKADGENLTSAELMHVGKLLDTLENLQNEKIITVEPYRFGDQEGVPTQFTSENVKALGDMQASLEMSLGREAFGRNSEMPLDISDAVMWNSIREANFITNIENVYELFDGKAPSKQYEDSARQISSLLTDIFSAKKNDIIVDNAKNIELIDLENLSKEDAIIINEFKNMMWAVLSTKSSRRAIDSNKMQVSAEKLLVLRDKLVENGMPDPAFYRESSVFDWYDTLIGHGVDQATRGMDLDPHKGIIVKRLMMNGIITQTTANSRGTRLVAPAEITVSQIKRIMGNNISNDQAKRISETYKEVISEVSDIVTVNPNFEVGQLSIDQLSSIISAGHINKPSKLQAGIDNLQSNILNVIGDNKNSFETLETRLKLMEEPSRIGSPGDEVRALMELNRAVDTELNRVHYSFLRSMGGGKEIARASANLELMSSLRGPGGKTLVDLLNELKGVTDDKSFVRITEEIKELQYIIAEKVSNRADIATSTNELMQERVRKIKHEEIEGRMKEDEKLYITPELFFEKYDPNSNYQFNQNYVSGASVTKTPSERMYELYKNTVGKGNTTGFTEELFNMAGTTQADASKELRAEIVGMANMFERRFKVKKVTLNESSGKGTFEDTEISHGFLTDLWSELNTGQDLLILNDSFFSNNRSTDAYTHELGFSPMDNMLRSHDFMATLEAGSSKYIEKFNKSNVSDAVDEKGNIIKTDYNHQEIISPEIQGKHYRVSIDENISILIPEASFQGVARRFQDWYRNVQSDPYVRDILRKNKYQAANDLFRQLEDYSKRIQNADTNGVYDIDMFTRDMVGTHESNMNDALFTMVNVMYAEKINGDWLNDAFSSDVLARKHFKYKRLAQNLGYSRNSKLRRRIAKEVYNGTEHQKLVDKFSELETFNALVIDDSQSIDYSNAAEVSKLGTNGFITQNKAVALASLEKQKDTISKEVYDSWKRQLEASNALDAEAVNGMTIVSRDMLDYLLLMNGQEALIGKSSGQKPVGLSSFKDADGNMHVFYNKTHYFYDAKLDPFFANNPDISQVGFKSGVKKSVRINKGKSENSFVPYAEGLPSVGDGVAMTDYINGIKVDGTSGGVMKVDFSHTLSGTIYGSPHDTRIMKQFSNWGSEALQTEIYDWARSDMINRFADIQVRLYNPENTLDASLEAREFIRSKENSEGIMNANESEAPFQSIWIDAGGVPTSVSKNLFDSFMKKKYIDNAGVFDGFTDAGGAPILRGNLNGDLKVPVYDGRKQIVLGEANVTLDYLDRPIHFSDDYGVVRSVTRKDGQRVIGRKNYRKKSTITVVLENKTGNELARDLLIDLKTGEITDPNGQLAHISQLKKGSKADKFALAGIENLMNRVKNGNINTYLDLYKDIKNIDLAMQGPSQKRMGLKLALMTMPAPRTGPHDAVISKIKDLLPSGDGGLMELNAYDVTMRAQRDYDTDKMPFYLDTPFLAMSESYRKNGEVFEPGAIDPKRLETNDLNPFDRKSFDGYKSRIKKFSKVRGPIMRFQRKLSYGEVLFNKLTNGAIELGDGSRLVVTKNLQKTKQEMVTYSQAGLDIYDKLPLELSDMNKFQDNILFGNGKDVATNEPFFQLEVRNESGDGWVRAPISSKAHQFILKKVLNDFGRLLSIEGKVYEDGESRTPKYTDMVQMYGDFKREYSAERINWNFYHYLLKVKQDGQNVFSKEVVNEMFFDKKDYDSEGKLTKQSEIKPLFQELSQAVGDNPNTFLKALDGIASKDLMKVIETVRPSGDYFNVAVNKLIGKNRSEMLEIFRITGDLTSEQMAQKNTIIDEMWKMVRESETHEGLMVQFNNLQWQIDRAGKNIAHEKASRNPDEAHIEMMTENLILHQEALNSLINKMSIDKDFHGQNYIHYSGKDNASNKHTANRTDVVIRDSRTGEVITTKRKGDNYKLFKNQVAVENPVIFKPITDHEAIDGAAMANTVLGFRAHVKNEHMDIFTRIVGKTRKALVESMKNVIETSGHKDFSKHQFMASEIITNGLKELKREVSNSASISELMTPKPSFMGDMPSGTETYGLDFIMSILGPGTTGNANEYYYSPKTGGFMPAVKGPSKSIVSAAMDVVRQYNVVPDYKAFVSEFANAHRGFYDAIVAGKGFKASMERLSETSFEGAILSNTINKVMHSPFAPAKEYKNMQEYMDMVSGVGSEFAELYGQILFEQGMMDPGVSFRLRRELVETYGQEAYDNMFKVGRKEIVFDGLNSLMYQPGMGQGQVIGEIIGFNKVNRNRKLVGQRPTKGSTIEEHLRQVVGDANFKVNDKGELKCD